MVIVLSLVVIISLILVAFVTVMRMDRVASASYGQSLAVEQIGLGALDRVVGEFRNEMSADAPPQIVSGKPVYTNVSSANISPQQFGTNAAMPSLIRTSVDNAFTNASGGVVGTLRASAVSSSSASFNQRLLDTNRWNAPRLGLFPDNYSVPNWVIITRNGTTNTGSFGTTGATLNNSSPANNCFAIGRFAYAVYNVGGLLDVTAAGYPSGLSASQVNQLKSCLAGADLSAVGISNGAGKSLVAWRNAATSVSSNMFLSYVTNSAAKKGFLEVPAGDTTFLDRQDLIKAAESGKIDGLDVNALPHLTVFSREKNAPSWGPAIDAGTVGGVNFNYASQANQAASVNRFVSSVRYATPGTVRSYRGDGASFDFPVVAGDSLLQRRFPLSRLSWLGPNGPQNGGTAQNILACFGLQWMPATQVWQYVGSSGSALQSSIATLQQVAAEIPVREPNFFELLQAGILSGSLGVSSTPSAVNGVVKGAPSLHQASAMLQILRIGASVIDQYDADSNPTVIEYSESILPPTTVWQAAGVEDLPYLNSLRVLPGTSPDTASALASYLTVGLWNPHQTQALSLARPDLRLRVEGAVRVSNAYADAPVTAVISGTAGSSAIGINAGSFHDPALLASGNVSSLPGNGTTAGLEWAVTPPISGAGGTTAIGYRLPDLPLNLTKPAVNEITQNSSLGVSFQAPFQISLEYKTASGNWLAYSRLNGVNDSRTWMGTASVFYCWLGSLNDSPADTLDAAKFGAGFNNYAGLRLTGRYNVNAGFSMLNPIRLATDPRSLRFTWLELGGSSYIPKITQGGNAALWADVMPDAAYQLTGYGFDNAWTTISSEAVPPLFKAGGTGAYNNQANPKFFPARLARNNTDNSGTFSSYADRDGIRRVGDSGMFASTTSAGSGNPYGRDADRPIVLNRPFQSVAELGYALRDNPWKSLDFFSTKSADAALLDLFCVAEAEVPVAAGKIDLNTRDPLALEAVLRGALPDVLDAGHTALSNPGTIATNLVNFTASQRLANKSDLVTRFVGDTSVFPATGDESAIKMRREVVSRALGEVGQTRTWNLLIDLVAQAGKYPPQANALSQFVVEGERRYWLHVAIDRFTGEIIDRRLEQITE